MNSKPFPETLPEAFLETMAGTLRTLGHPQRLRILEYLDLQGESTVGEIVSALKLPQGAVSQHLNKMCASGVLTRRRDGRQVWYRAGLEHSLTILNCMRRKYQECK